MRPEGLYELSVLIYGGNLRTSGWKRMDGYSRLWLLQLDLSAQLGNL